MGDPARHGLLQEWDYYSCSVDGQLPAGALTVWKDSESLLYNQITKAMI